MSSLPTLVTSPVTETNKLDFESILKAQLLPGQIWIRIVYDMSDAVELNAMGALAAKLLLSSSPTSRNVEPESCDTSDRVLAAWLLINNYNSSGNENAPLEVRRKNRGHSQFTGLAGDGATRAVPIIFQPDSRRYTSELRGSRILEMRPHRGVK